MGGQKIHRKAHQKLLSTGHHEPHLHWKPEGISLHTFSMHCSHHQSQYRTKWISNLTWHSPASPFRMGTKGNQRQQDPVQSARVWCIAHTIHRWVDGSFRNSSRSDEGVRRRKIHSVPSRTQSGCQHSRLLSPPPHIKPADDTLPNSHITACPTLTWSTAHNEPGPWSWSTGMALKQSQSHPLPCPRLHQL